MHQSLTGSSIYSSGRAPQRITTTECTPMVCMALFQYPPGPAALDSESNDNSRFVIIQVFYF